MLNSKRHPWRFFNAKTLTEPAVPKPGPYGGGWIALTNMVQWQQKNARRTDNLGHADERVKPWLGWPKCRRQIPQNAG